MPKAILQNVVWLRKKKNFVVFNRKTSVSLGLDPQDMLEDRPCLVSRDYPRSCERDNWPMSFRPEKHNVQQGKRPLETNDEEGVVRKVSKQSTNLILKMNHDQSGSQQLTVDNSDSISLIGGILTAGHDLSDQSGRPQNACDNSDSTSLIGESSDLEQDQSDQSRSHHHAGDNSDSSSLISSIGRDNSISCLIRCSRADYGAIATLNRSFRSFIRSGELYRLRRINGVVEHWVYFSCHLLEWEAFDPNRRRWMHLPSMNPNDCFVFADKESLAVGTELLVFGRDLMSHAIYRYSLLTNSWTTGMIMNEPRCLFGSASLGEIAILAGGSDSHGNILSSAELYNSETGAWKILPSMKKPRKMCSAVFMDGKFYVIGGVGGADSKLLTCGEVYSLETETWTEIPNMSPVGIGAARNNERPATSVAPPLIAVVNNELYSADYTDMVVRKYDKDDMEWKTMGRLPERADSMYGWGLAFRACGDRLIVIGGPRTAGEGFIEVNSWVPSEGPPQWDVLGHKRSGSFVYNCAVMGC